MAIDLETTYPGNVDTATAAYPFGVPRNVSAPSAGDGTPWEEAIVRDLFGFLAAVLQDATPPIVPTNTADTALASQYLDGLKSILLQRSELVENGGGVITVGRALKLDELYGMGTTRDSGVLMTVLPGGARNAGNTRDLELAASLQKDISATWVQGAGGGRPAAVPLTASTWYRCFIVTKPDGSDADIVWDTSPTCAAFFATEGAAAGYTDATMYSRFRWSYVAAGSTFKDYFNPADDPRETVWVAEDVAGWTDTSVSRSAQPVLAAPLTVVRGSVQVFDPPLDGKLYVSTAGQSDLVVGEGVTEGLTVWCDGTSSTPIYVVYGEWETDAASQLFCRVDDTAAFNSIAFRAVAYRDNGIAA